MCNISNMGGSVSLGYPNTEKRVENMMHKFVEIWGVWIADETLSQVFDIIFSIENEKCGVNREINHKNLC